MRLIEDIRNAVTSGRLKEPFRAADIKAACPNWADTTYSNFLGKHAVGNPSKTTELFIRVSSGLYQLNIHV
ncbi:MAG: hypothetical protein JKY46_11400 [Robiginitomaculum sp.]|nr:hypothetical protein [Robiginitomaculum sp.]